MIKVNYLKGEHLMGEHLKTFEFLKHSSMKFADDNDSEKECQTIIRFKWKLEQSN